MSQKRTLSPDSEAGASSSSALFRSLFKKVRTDAAQPSNPHPRRALKRKTADEIQSDGEVDQPPTKTPPLAPIRPAGGRPSHGDRGLCTDQAPAAKLNGLILPQTPPQKQTSEEKKAEHAKRSKKNSSSTFLSPESSRIAKFRLQPRAQFHFVSPKAPITSRTNSRKNKTQSTSHMSVKAVSHSEEQHWVAGGNCLTVETYYKFETWKNDYMPKSYDFATSVKMIHLGNPCDHPQDIRARKWILGWNTPDRNVPPELVDQRLPVMRIVYKCSGHCRHGAPASETTPSPAAATADDGNWEDLDDGEYVDVDDDEEDTTDKHPQSSTKPLQDLSMKELNARINNGSVFKVGRKPRSEDCNVILHAEVYSDDLSKVYFFQQHEHPETLPQYLDFSRYIRQCMLEMARTLGLSPASIKRCLLHLFTEDAEHPTPAYCWPDATQVNNIVNNARRKERLLSDPLLSIGVFAELNPDRIFRYTEPDYSTDPPRNFSTGIHHQYGTQAMLLWAWLHGIGLDSTYRHMNENRAPLTIMITLDSQGTMVPGFAYLSSDTTTESQVHFLQDTKRLVEEMAAKLVNGEETVAMGLEEHSEELMKQARHVPSDRYILDWLYVSESVKFDQILIFDGDISCYGPYESSSDAEILHAGLGMLPNSADASNRSAKGHERVVKPYWITLRLTGSVRNGVIFGLTWDSRWEQITMACSLPTTGPSEHSRHLTKSFLEIATTNPFIFRLVLILVNEWFQFYQVWKPRKQLDSSLFEIGARGHLVWSCEGAVQPFMMADGRQAWRVADIE
ncbi:hypothetical protein C8R43DRAFT_1118068 [Mycena crocata]|nr:hypothetical protein C8R43DRAFT_1118068 [Mycena crocata]